MTWQQDKNPQDGSGGTDCPHAQPGTSHSCVIPVSRRAHPPATRPRLFPGPELQSCGGQAQLRDPPPTAGRQHGASSVAEHHWGAANVHVRRRGATSGAEHHRGATQTAVRQRQWQSTTVVPPTYACAVLARAAGRNATVAPPRHPCASLAMVFPLGQYSRRHGEDYTWCSTSLRDTSCKGDVTLAVLTASRVIGDTRRLGRPPGASGRAPLWCRQHARAPSWRDLQGRAPPWRRPDSRTPTWRQLSDRAPPWCHQRTHAPSWRNLQGRAPPWRRPDNRA